VVLAQQGRELKLDSLVSQRTNGAIKTKVPERPEAKRATLARRSKSFLLECESCQI
jgi:hypothetical protein